MGADALERPVLIYQGKTSHEVHRELLWPVLGTLVAPLVLGCLSVYLFRLSGSGTAVALALAFLMIGLLACTTLVLFPQREEVAASASAVALVLSVAFLIVLLPSSGLIYADEAAMVVAAGGAVLLYLRKVEMPTIGLTRLRESSVAVVFLLPIGLALAESLFLGLRFWESYHIGSSTILLVPMLAAWGFIEEGLFRGVLLRSSVPLLGTRGALLLSSFLYAAFMLLWGSLPFALFSFALGWLMGVLYLRSRSLMYVGTVHALTDTWMVISFIVLGIGVN
ncbi:MAG: CPBP family intramembrane glutamic endopeptidase [Methanomassiliicoccus sp.]|nr:CPBP family intramembrane glutamic endopeptidase [Methanomassiliicoccus sp.]